MYLIVCFMRVCCEEMIKSQGKSHITHYLFDDPTTIGLEKQYWHVKYSFALIYNYGRYATKIFTIYQERASLEKRQNQPQLSPLIGQEALF